MATASVIRSGILGKRAVLQSLTSLINSGNGHSYPQRYGELGRKSGQRSITAAKTVMEGQGPGHPLDIFAVEERDRWGRAQPSINQSSGI